VKQVCVQLPTSAGNVALPALAAVRRVAAAECQPCINRSMSPARWACSSKPTIVVGRNIRGILVMGVNAPLPPDAKKILKM